MVITIFIVISGWLLVIYSVVTLARLVVTEEEILQAFENSNAVVGFVVVRVGDDDDTSGQDWHEDGHDDGEQHERRHQVDDGSYFGRRQT